MHTRRLPPLILVLFAAACGGDAPAVGSVIIDYPIEGSVFPPDFTPPTILWHDADARADRFRIEFEFTDGGDPLAIESAGPPPPRGEIDETVLGRTNEIYEGTPYQRSARSFTPEADLWAAVQRRSVAGPATLRVAGFLAARPQEILSRGQSTFSTSTDPVGAPIFYRDVPLMPGKGKDGTIAPLDPASAYRIAWRLRDVSRPDSKLVLTGLPTCANCHSFSLDGRTLGMDIDGPDGDKGTYAVAPVSGDMVIDDDEIITWNSFPDKPENHKTIGFLSRISPDGEYVLSTVNEALYVNNFTNYRFLQVFYPTRGILAWYSKETGVMKSLPGADDPEFVHCSPVWFPDGKQIVFARARARDPYPEGQPRPTHAGDENELPMQYDLYRMPFHEGRGGTPVPIEGASRNGMSNTFPKISPDGKWLVFTKCKNGLLIRPDSRLWIVPAEGGQAREMNCNTALMNSWHSFSPNGRWMVFTSKVNRPYTQMFLTHLDEDGNDTPPILIPHSTADNRAVNIPEFVNRDFETFNSISVPAVKHYRGWNDAVKLIEQGSFEEAIVVLERALAQEPEFSRALVTLGFALLETGRTEEARERLIRATELDPGSSLARVNLGLTYVRENRPNSAAEQFQLAISIDPGDALAHRNLGLVRLRQESFEEAQASLRTAAALDPASADTRVALGQTLLRLHRETEAIAEFTAALELAPDHPVAHGSLAGILLQRGDPAKALPHLRTAVEFDPENAALRSVLAEVLLSQGLGAESLAHLEKLLAFDAGDPSVQLKVAFLLSTLPQDSLRDGARALRLALSCRGKIGDRADVLDVLAAAYAANGRFRDAVTTALRALELERQGQPAAAPGLPARLADYRAGRPHRR